MPYVIINMGVNIKIPQNGINVVDHNQGNNNSADIPIAMIITILPITLLNIRNAHKRNRAACNRRQLAIPF